MNAAASRQSSYKIQRVPCNAVDRAGSTRPLNHAESPMKAAADSSQQLGDQRRAVEHAGSIGPLDRSERPVKAKARS